MTHNEFRRETDLGLDLAFVDEQVAEARCRIASARSMLNNRSTSLTAGQVMECASAVLAAAIAQLERIEKVRHS